MNIYISGALMGAQNLDISRKLYESFYSTCKNLGFVTYLPHKKTDPDKNKNLDSNFVFKQDSSELDKANIIVAYIGQPSLGVGAEISMAIQKGKVIIALYEQENPKVSRFIKGLLNEYFNGSFIVYKTESEANQLLHTRLKEIKQTQLQTASI